MLMRNNFADQRYTARGPLHIFHTREHDTQVHVHVAIEVQKKEFHSAKCAEVTKEIHPTKQIGQKVKEKSVIFHAKPWHYLNFK